MVETRLEMRHFLQKGFHVRGVPQEASCRVLKREENTVSMTQSAKLLSDFIQIVGCLNTGLQIWAQSRKAIWKLVCPQNGWVVSKTALWKQCRMAVQNERRYIGLAELATPGRRRQYHAWGQGKSQGHWASNGFCDQSQKSHENLFAWARLLAELYRRKLRHRKGY